MKLLIARWIVYMMITVLIIGFVYAMYTDLPFRLFIGFVASLACIGAVFGWATSVLDTESEKRAKK